MFAGLIGFPLKHSLSPEIFSFLSKRFEKKLDYRKYEVTPDQIEASILRFKSIDGFVGLNVTLPYKERVLPWVDSLSPSAQQIGAVNVIHFNQGLCTGYNTDFLGIEKSLIEQGFSIPGSRSMIYGSGGAALAFASVLGKNQGQTVYLVNRDYEKAKRVAGLLSQKNASTEFIPVCSNEAFPGSEKIDLFVNATPQGMDGFPILKESFISAHSRSLAFDLVYKPRHTPFLLSAERKGIQTVGGLDMLVWQALATWEIWFGNLSEVNSGAIKKELKEFLTATENPETGG